VKLTRVTITGADAAVDPLALAQLAAEYPWLELGFLFSLDRLGTPRYPDTEWWGRAGRLLEDVPRAIHLCGEAARAVLSGLPVPLPPLALARGCRLQLNGFSSWRIPRLAAAETAPHIQCILQCNTVAAMGEALRLSALHGNVSALFDASGGAGRYQPELWPVPPGSLRVGYAGGINEFNVEEALRGLTGMPGSHAFWIDVETGARDERDEFDLAKARRILALAAPFISSELP
jgi:hypothetical protein